jgi:pimeloyl-ACP methyl ester carboxylesterase
LLAAKGYRVLVPYLRGHGTTRFLSSETPRNGQQAALASDCVAFMDSLKIERAVLAGFDWGARTANIVAALWPERCKAMVSVSGYLIVSRERTGCPCRRRPSSHGGTSTTSRRTEVAQAMTNTATSSRSSFGRPRRRNGGSTTRRSTARRRRSTTRIMSTWSSIITGGGWDWRRASRSTMISNDSLRRGRRSRCPPSRLKATPTARHIWTPPAAYAKQFSGKYAHRLLTGGIGHNPPQEAPHSFADAVVAADEL